MANVLSRVLDSFDIGELFPSNDDLDLLQTQISNHVNTMGEAGHIPSGGAAGQFLDYRGQWATPPDHTYTGGTSIVLNGSSFERAALSGGDVTASQNSNNLSIVAGSVTLAKMANLAANSIIGNNTASAATPIALSALNVRTMLGISNGTTNTGKALTATATEGVYTWTQFNNYTHPNHTGDVTSTGDGATVIAAGAVTLAKMANLAANSILGNNTGSAVAPIALTGSQVKAMLSLAKADVGLGNVDNTADTNKAVLSASKWTTARSLSATGDATGTVASVDGSANISLALTLAASGVTAGTYRSVTVDAKGRVTAGTTDGARMVWITNATMPDVSTGYKEGDIVMYRAITGDKYRPYMVLET